MLPRWMLVSVRTMLGHVECPLKCLVQPPAGVPMPERQIVSLFQLPQDFRFPKHHRIQPARHAEQVRHALRFAQRIQFPGGRVGAAGARRQESLQLLKRGRGLKRRRGVDFHPVAGGKDDGLVGNALLPQPLDGGGNARLFKREPFAHGDGRRMMAQADDENGHDQQWQMANGKWHMRLGARGSG